MRIWYSLVGMCFALTSMAATQSPVSGQWSVPRTSDGHPDLQGNWTNVTITPFQRREGREPVFTWEEVAELEGREADLRVRTSQASDPDRAPPEIRSDPGGYNYIYIDRGTQVAIVNGEPRTSLLTDPPNGRRPPLTAEGQRRVEARREFRSQFGTYDNPENRPLGERCIVSFGTSAGPPMIPNNFYNNNYTIVQTSHHVMIMSEMVHDVRVIRLGEPNPLRTEVQPWFGDSWGRWEGDVLVVETTNLNPRHPFRGIVPTEHTEITERFSRVDEDSILYEFTIEDPTTYTQSWGGEIPFERFDDLLYEYSCHEGNYALTNILSGARYQETQSQAERQ